AQRGQSLSGFAPFPLEGERKREVGEGLSQKGLGADVSKVSCGFVAVTTGGAEPPASYRNLGEQQRERGLGLGRLIRETLVVFLGAERFGCVEAAGVGEPRSATGGARARRPLERRG